MLGVFSLLLITFGSHVYSQGWRYPKYYDTICRTAVGQVPNPRDPYSFFKCDGTGRAHLFHCPSGTMYDQWQGICDWQDVVLQKNYGNGGYNYPNNDYYPTGGNKGSGTNKGVSNDYPVGNGFGGNLLNDERFIKKEVKMDCTDDSSGPTKLYQNPNDCSTYYTCNLKKPVLTYCPYGLYYNPKRRGCDDTIQPGCKVLKNPQRGSYGVYERSQ